MKIKNVTLGVSLLIGTVAMPATAQDITVDGLLGLVTDYRENGVSLTSKDPAAIGNLRLTHKSGLYGDIFLASMGDRSGDDVIVDSTLGYSWDGDVYSYSLATSLKSYHGGPDESRFYPEIKASISRDFGIFYVKGGLEYAFDGRWFAQDNNAIYGSIDLELPVPKMPELTVVTHLGYDMIDGYQNGWDWRVGLSAFHKDFELTLMYDDSSLNIPDASGTVSFGLKWYF
ncbi:TorF family putative porin [Temperatibacter marinus]|uniref:TorF family putative porin n=1 Tax=Temperatibacter marinus TaxID=1456591 RepID=A0AA52EFY4_9PROT|nr:TorF family putative porin [Temperatibacter marinus]WND01604.1 TorF family putative porin [Temperatibacter marinus]